MTAPPDAPAPSDPGAPPRENWFDRPMRWAQLTLAENDPARYDVRFWLDYFKEVHADAACLSAGGCVAYYPTTSRCTTVAGSWVTATPSGSSSRAAAGWG